MIPEKKKQIIQFCTKNCVVCGGPAMFVGGHVHKDTVIVFARVCHGHLTIPGRACQEYPKGGCRGKWEDFMGLINAEGALVDPKKVNRA